MKLLLFAIATAAATTAAAQTAKRPPVLVAPVPPRETACIKVQAKPAINMQPDTLTITRDTTYYEGGRVINKSSKIVITLGSITTTDKVATFTNSIIISRND